MPPPADATVAHRRLASLGLAGSAIISIGCVLAAIAYVGNHGQRYSPLNHWISELGEVAESELHLAFDLGLILGGPMLAVFMVGLGRMVGGGWGIAIALSGLIAGIGGTLVGVFPMDDLSSHAVAALTFFVAAPIAIGLFTVWLLRERPVDVPRSLVLPGVFAVGCFVIFLGLLFTSDTRSLASPTDRPDVWPLVIFEWLTLVGVLSWFVAVAAVLWVRRRT